MASNTPDSSIAALEQQIQDLETKISNVETKADQAEAKGDPEGLRFYRAKEQQLRRKEEQLREEKARKEAALDKDWTERKIADLLSPRLIHTPDLEGLRRIMGSGLGPDGKGCLPLHAAELAAITAGQPSLADKLEDMSLSHAVALASHVAVALRRGYTLGDEISLAGAFDNVFRSTLAFIATNQGGTTMNLRMVRNSSEDSATLKRMRPDFGLQVRSALLLKGEDKTAYTHMRVAEAELIEKMREWSVFYHGKVPYMLAYAQAEGLVRFHAILRERPGELQRLHPHEINANTVYGRIQLLTCAFHIFRILEVLQKELPEEVRPLNTEVTRSNGTRILYFADNVRKQMPAGEQGIDPPRLAVLQDIYNRTKGCQHVITAMTPPQLEMSRGEGPIYRVYLQPVGMGLGPHYPGMPQTEAELATAVWCILQGLRSIHATGFGHGDLRWENVILVPPRRYILIDLESVIKLGSKVQLPYPAAFESGQSLSRDRRYTVASDLYSLGAMMEASQVPLSDQGESFVGELKASRATVSAALQNGWLQQRLQ